MEERIADIPAIVPFLERLTALALPLVHILDPMSVSNIFWALGTLRLSPGGKCHIIRAHPTSEHSLEKRVTKTVACPGELQYCV